MAVPAGLLVTRAGAAADNRGDDVRLDAPADVTLRIAPVQVEIASGRIINTVGYNGTAPGPLVRFREGVTATVDVFNDTATPEFVHWHGFNVPCDVDGAEEEGSLVAPAHGRLRYRLTPIPSGCRYVHTHNMSMSDLNRGAFTGQFAFAYIEPKHDPGGYDQQIFLATHEWGPYLTRMEQPEDSSPQRQAPQHKSKDNQPHGWEAGYRHFTINGKCLGHGEPIQVKEGQRILFHFLNASATESVRLALPGHRFQVVALDGNPVPRPQLVDVLDLGTAERIDAVVTMDTPGVFVLGTPLDSHRAKGMGIVVEYANRSGKPSWVRPPASRWNYTIFGERRPAPKPDVVIPLVIRQAGLSKAGFDQWTINGKTYDAATPPTRLTKGRRHRLIFDNRTDDVHPVHLHRNSFELTSVYGTPTSGVMKDVVVVKSRQKVEVDVTPHMEGLALFHCHQQLHMDYGFKMLFNVV
ncbi:MAG TPA: multicopper oxidase domain-containing protein [Candidatus Acidoferrum sp.]|nr:multicopper oxidase domain-containing protein [Candidatus Acidoferrum sp.]